MGVYTCVIIVLLFFWSRSLCYGYYFISFICRMGYIEIETFSTYLVSQHH